MCLHFPSTSSGLAALASQLCSFQPRQSAWDYSCWHVSRCSKLGPTTSPPAIPLSEMEWRGRAGGQVSVLLCERDKQQRSGVDAWQHSCKKQRLAVRSHKEG
eukprot:jgi/Ulvmu1/9493/UM052_0063.1